MFICTKILFQIFDKIFIGVLGKTARKIGGSVGDIVFRTVEKTNQKLPGISKLTSIFKSGYELKSLFPITGPNLFLGKRLQRSVSTKYNRRALQMKSSVNAVKI